VTPDLDAIEVRCAAATPGPWAFDDSTDRRGEKGEFRAPSPYSGFMLVRAWSNPADAEFIAAARADIPALLAALREAWAERDEALRRAVKAEAETEQLRQAIRRKYEEYDRLLDLSRNHSERATRAEAERDEARAALDRVRALCDEADGNAVVVEHICHPHHY